ncbi:hypothetical protein YC2023_081328 [Brassica napus]
MLSLWLLVFYSAAPVTFPAMAVNCFSGESPDEIYSGAFPQLVWTRFVFVPLWRCLLTSSSDLSASVKPPIAIACFSCSRSFQCTDLNSHRLLPSSPAPCPMNPFPKGMTSSALLWCEPSIRSGSCSSDLARFENLGLSAHDVQSPRAMEYLFADLQIPLPPLAYFGLWWRTIATSRSRQWSLSPPNPRMLKLLPPLSYHVMCLVCYLWETPQDVPSVSFNSYLSGLFVFRNPSLSTSSFSRQCSISVPTLRAERDLSPSPPYQRRESFLCNPSIQALTSIIAQWVV